MVVLSDAYYPGWQATVDGSPANIYRVDCDMRGVIVAPGQHTIIMSYHPFSFKVGMGISLFSFVGLGSIGVVLMVRRRRERKPQD